MANCSWRLFGLWLSSGTRAKVSSTIPSLAAATNFLSVLNDAHPAINNSFPFAGMVINETDNRLNTCVCRRNTNKGLLLHYLSHVDNRSKQLLIRTLIDCANRLSSSPDLSSKECEKSILNYTFCINTFHTNDKKLQHSWTKQRQVGKQKKTKSVNEEVFESNSCFLVWQAFNFVSSSSFFEFPSRVIIGNCRL